MRLTRLDVMRGLAALSVVVFHFEGPGSRPLDWLLWPLYDYGGLAVQFFWLLSGIVFMRVYGSGEVSGREFFVRRFARLYPLHFVTLLAMAGLNAIHPLLPGNDLPHFVLQLFMASNWFSMEHSFNFPIWSVSMEVVAYAAFFAFLKLTNRTLPTIALCAGAFTFIALIAASYLATCCALFFIGAGIFSIAPRIAWKTALSALAFGAAFVVAVSLSPLSRHWLLAVSYAFLPPLLLCVTMLDLRRGPIGIKWVGNITYGVYLTHIPILTVFALSGFHPSGTWFLFAFIGIVVAVSLLAYRFVEVPGQRVIMSWFHKRSSSRSRRHCPIL